MGNIDSSMKTENFGDLNV